MNKFFNFIIGVALVILSLLPFKQVMSSFAVGNWLTYAITCIIYLGIFFTIYILFAKSFYANFFLIFPFFAWGILLYNSILIPETPFLFIFIQIIGIVIYGVAFIIIFKKTYLLNKHVNE